MGSAEKDVRDTKTEMWRVRKTNMSIDTVYRRKKKWRKGIRCWEVTKYITVKRKNQDMVMCLYITLCIAD